VKVERASCICPMHCSFVASLHKGFHQSALDGLHLLDALLSRCAVVRERAVWKYTTLHLSDALKIRCYGCADGKA